jgi:hypothetical protein
MNSGTRLGTNGRLLPCCAVVERIEQTRPDPFAGGSVNAAEKRRARTRPSRRQIEMNLLFRRRNGRPGRLRERERLQA